MREQNCVNVKLLDLELNKLKSAARYKIGMLLRLSSNMIGHENNETNFPHKLLLADR